MRRGRGKKGVDTDEPADHALGRCRGGFGSKLHLLTDGRGHVLQVVLTRGNRNECRMLGPLLGSTVAREQRRPQRLACDKGYSADRIRLGLPQIGIEPVIPLRRNEHVNDRDAWPFDKDAYRGRNVVERAVAKLKEFRRIATRYEKLASAYCAMLSLASIVLYLRVLDS
jgi:transposase